MPACQIVEFPSAGVVSGLPAEEDAEELNFDEEETALLVPIW